MGNARMRVTRWMVCAGAGQYLDIAGRLVASGCAEGIEWETSPARCLARLSQLPEGSVGVVASEGCDGQPALDLAVSAAAMPASALTVLCVRQAQELEAAARDRGVAACVGLDGLLGVLAGLRADWEGAECLPPSRAKSPAWDEPAARPVPGVRPAGRPGRVGVEPDPGRCASGEPLVCERGQGGAREASREVAGRMRDDDLDLDEPWDAAREGDGGRQEADPEGGGARGSATAFDERRLAVGRQTSADQPEEEVTRAVPAAPATPVARVSVSSDAELASDPVPTICLASARGGVGKSTLAVLMALAMAQEGLRVALIDLDYQFGTCLGFLGLDETDGLPEPRDGRPLSLDDRMLERCRVQATPGLLAYEFCRMPELSELFAPLSGQLVRAARGRCDVALVDLPAGMSESAAQVFELSDRCLIVGDQQALSLESMAAAVALSTRLGVPRTKLLAVLNRCDARHRDEGFVSRARFELQTPQIMRVVDGGPEVTRMLELGCAGELVTMRNRCALSSADLASALCTELGCGRPAGTSQAARELPAASAPARRRRPRHADLREELVPCL